MATAYYLPRPQHTDNNGAVLTLGRLNFFEAGTVDTRKDVFLDKDLTVVAPNPLNLDAAGRTPDGQAVVYYGYGNYKVTCESNATGVWSEVWQAPYIEGTPAPGSAILTSDELVCNTIADLKDVDVTQHERAFVLGAASIGGGGGGHYYWAASSTVVDDGGWYLQRNVGGIGRWIRILQAGETELDIRIWQLVSNVGPIDGGISSASAISASLKLPIYFPPGIWKFQDDTTITAKSVISNGAKLGFVSSSNYTITFSAPVNIVSTETIVTGNNVMFDFTSLSGLQQIDSRWGYNLAHSAAISAGNDVPLYIDVPTTLSAPISMQDNTVIGENGSLSFSGVGLQSSYFTVLGTRRRVLASDGSHFLVTNATVEHQAWWWGYGIDTALSDHTEYLFKAHASAAASLAPLCVNANVFHRAVNGILTLSVPTRIEGAIPLGSAAIVVIARLNGTHTIPLFDFQSQETPTGCVTDLALSPEWFGGSVAGAAPQNDLAFRHLVKSLNYAAAYPTTVIGNGRAYQISTPITPAIMWRAQDLWLHTINGSQAFYADASAGLREFHMTRCKISSDAVMTGLQSLDVTINNADGNASVVGCDFAYPPAIRTVAGAYPCAISVASNRFQVPGILQVTTNISNTVDLRDNDMAGAIYVDANAITFGNVRISGNILRCLPALGDIQIRTAINGTNCRNVQITNNLLPWGTTPSSAILINAIQQGDGSWNTFQETIVAENTTTSLYTKNSSYPNLGIVEGPFVSSTRGATVVNFPEQAVGVVPINYNQSVTTLVGPLFVPSGQLFEKKEVTLALGGEWWCEQAGTLSAQGISFDDPYRVSMHVRRKNGMPVDGRYFHAICQACAAGIESNTGQSDLWVKPKANLSWSLRCDQGKYSKTI